MENSLLRKLIHYLENSSIRSFLICHWTIYQEYSAMPIPFLTALRKCKFLPLRKSLKYIEKVYVLHQCRILSSPGSCSISQTKSQKTQTWILLVIIYFCFEAFLFLDHSIENYNWRLFSVLFGSFMILITMRNSK